MTTTLQRIGCTGLAAAIRQADRARYGDRLLTELAGALDSQGVSGVGRRQLGLISTIAVHAAR